jgi:hypothetical protein
MPTQLSFLQSLLEPEQSSPGSFALPPLGVPHDQTVCAFTVSTRQVLPVAQSLAPQHVSTHRRVPEQLPPDGQSALDEQTVSGAVVQRPAQSPERQSVAALHD